MKQVIKLKFGKSVSNECFLEVSNAEIYVLSFILKKLAGLQLYTCTPSLVSPPTTNQNRVKERDQQKSSEYCVIL